MAPKRSLSTHLIDYAQLNNFSSVVLCDTAPRKKKGNIFQVERLISQKKVKQDIFYLIKWAGWPLESSTWEPSSNLSSELLMGYDRPPKPTINRMEHAVRAFSIGILSMLKSKSLGNGHVEIDHDIWRYVVHGKGTKCAHRGYFLYEKQDFTRFSMLPPDWWYFLTGYGEGKKIDFPLKAKAVLLWSPRKHMLKGTELLEAARFPIEKINITFARLPCNQENIFS